MHTHRVVGDDRFTDQNVGAVVSALDAINFVRQDASPVCGRGQTAAAPEASNIGLDPSASFPSVDCRPAQRSSLCYRGSRRFDDRFSWRFALHDGPQRMNEDRG